jgi:hypothetical protein
MGASLFIRKKKNLIQLPNPLGKRRGKTFDF